MYITFSLTLVYVLLSFAIVWNTGGSKTTLLVILHDGDAPLRTGKLDCGAIDVKGHNRQRGDDSDGPDKAEQKPHNTRESDKHMESPSNHQAPFQLSEELYV